MKKKLLLLLTSLGLFVINFSIAARTDSLNLINMSGSDVEVQLKIKGELKTGEYVKIYHDGLHQKTWKHDFFESTHILWWRVGSIMHVDIDSKKIDMLFSFPKAIGVDAQLMMGGDKNVIDQDDIGGIITNINLYHRSGLWASNLAIINHIDDDWDNEEEFCFEDDIIFLTKVKYWYTYGKSL
jgi:hypothetical protein